MLKINPIERNELFFYLKEKSKEKSKEKFKLSENFSNDNNAFTYTYNNRFSCNNTSLCYLESIDIISTGQNRDIKKALSTIIFFETLLTGHYFSNKIENIAIHGTVLSLDLENPSFMINSIRICCGDVHIVFFPGDRLERIDRLFFTGSKREISIYVKELTNIDKFSMIQYLEGLQAHYNISKEMITSKNIKKIRQIIEMVSI